MIVDLTKSVRELRAALGESQQAFANRIGISIRAVANYEKDRQPRGKTLNSMAIAAESVGRDDLSEIFSSTLEKELGRGVPLAVINDLQLMVLRAQVAANDLRHAPKATRDQRADILMKHLRAMSELIDNTDPMSQKYAEDDK